MFLVWKMMGVNNLTEFREKVNKYFYSDQCLWSGSVGFARFWLPGSGSAKIWIQIRIFFSGGDPGSGSASKLNGTLALVKTILKLTLCYAIILCSHLKTMPPYINLYIFSYLSLCYACILCSRILTSLYFILYFYAM